MRDSPEQELRALRREAVDVWVAAAQRMGNPYTDRWARSVVRDQVMSALRDEDGATILRAITTRMDRESSPRRIPEWARLQGSDERAAAHTARMMSERDERAQVIEYHGTYYLGHVP